VLPVERGETMKHNNENRTNTTKKLKRTHSKDLSSCSSLSLSLPQRDHRRQEKRSVHEKERAFNAWRSTDRQKEIVSSLYIEIERHESECASLAHEK
jgi:hypothetical protein